MSEQHRQQQQQPPLTIPHPPNPNPSLISLEDEPSPSPLSPLPSPLPSHTDEKESYTDTKNPFSAFYSHPPTRTSLEQRKSESRVNVSISTPAASTSNVNLTKPPKSCRPNTPGTNLKNPYSKAEDGGESGGVRVLKKACTMWPTPSHASSTGRRKNLTGTVRGSRACAPYRRLSRGQRWALQILVALIVIGLGVGLGVGISRAVGAGVWKSENSRFGIPNEKGS